MSFRLIDLDIMTRGTILAIVEMLFPKGPPSLSDYARESSVAPSTFRRAAAWLFGLLPGLLKDRRPGPQSAEEPETEMRKEAIRQLEALKLWLIEDRRQTASNNCFSGEAKQRIAHLSEEIQAQGYLSFVEIAEALGIDERQLLRIRQEVKEAAGGAPEPLSRRPHNTGELAWEIQKLIKDIQVTAKAKSPYTATDIKRILEKNYKEQLLKYHGTETISLDTVSKFMKKAEIKPPLEHRRGTFNYPEPFQQVAIDTTHFNFFGMTFYFITVFEFSGRLNLLTRVFLRENLEAVVLVLEELFCLYPGLEVVVIDRGTPYLNAEVKALLERQGKWRLVAPVATPTAKAACERHFRTLKSVLDAAVARVFYEPPIWEKENLALMLELAVAVFQELYHQIPQEGIDGKTPAERIESFDPARACAMRLELFKRALDSEPVEDYARELHKRFQLPGKEEETVRVLRRFGTRILRQVVKRVSAYMGPPFPKWMYDPLGYLEMKAKKIYEAEQKAYLERRKNEEEDKKRRAADEEKKAKIAVEAREKEEHPERFIDSTLGTFIRCVEKNFAGGLKIMGGRLKEHLRNLAVKLGAAFSSEISRLKRRVRELTEKAAVQEKAIAFLDELVLEFGQGGGGS